MCVLPKEKLRSGKTTGQKFPRKISAGREVGLYVILESRGGTDHMHNEALKGSPQRWQPGAEQGSKNTAD